MTLSNRLTQSLNIRFPLIQAPMFLVSNEAMMKAGMDAGIMSVFPSLNFRDEGQLSAVIDSLKTHKDAANASGDFGVNLIVQKTNVMFEKHFKVCVDKKVPFYITSLGSPKEVIEAAHEYGGKVFCDVTNLKHAEKVAGFNCDGFIAVGSGAGGHAGGTPANLLVETLRVRYPEMMVIAAGGIATGRGIASALAAGADGVSVGTRFIASTEASINDQYKQAIVDANVDDIVMTTRLSGTPCSVILTDEVKQMGLEQNWLERKMNKSSWLKKYYKMLVQLKGMGKLAKSVKPGNYSNIWSAGKSVELIHDVSSIKDIVARLEQETSAAISDLNSMDMGSH